jgi:hypothetical protein
MQHVSTSSKYHDALHPPDLKNPHHLRAKHSLSLHAMLSLALQSENNIAYATELD